MATFAIKCPHCLRDNTSFTVIASAPPIQSQKSGWFEIETFATCNACHRGVCGTVGIPAQGAVAQLANYPGAIQPSARMWIGDWSPRAPLPDVPQHLPDAVTRTFTEAEQLRIAGFRGPAGNAYRRALEAGLKEVDSSLKGSLYSRIEKLTEAALLTPSMRDFAHRIRTLGNEASHETPVVEDDEIDDLAIFTKLFLMYQFTLPGMLPKQEEPAAADAAGAAT